MANRFRLRGRRARIGALALALTLVVLAGACSTEHDDTAGGGAAARRTSSTTALPSAATVAPKPSSGCTAAAKVAPGDAKLTFASGGVNGFYFRHVPPASDGTAPLPLVVDLHGYSEPAELQMKMSELGSYGDAHRFVTIEPETVAPVPRWDTASSSTDITWLGAVMDEVERTVCIDTARVYVTGLSNGAMMTSALACAMSDRIAAVAPVAGVTAIKGCAPKRAVPVIAFHGTADPFLAYDGGYGPQVAKLPQPNGKGTLGDLGAGKGPPKGPSVPEVMATWAKRDGCATTPKAKAVASDVTLFTYACRAGVDVELYRVTKGGHAWPGSAVSKSIAAAVGPTTFSINATELIWKFFEAHPLRG
jgi:polyhydroxybutyrate depolymerase